MLESGDCCCSSFPWGKERESCVSKF